MMDLIDRKQALKEINERHEKAVEWFFKTNDEIKARAEAAVASFTECYLTIQRLPSAEPGWIPVTDRLPEDTGKYLVTVKNGNVYAGTYDKFSGTFQCAATAWMPLPEPYEEAGE